MAQTERRRLITSTPHLSPDEVVQRSFTTSFRGYSESEVRAFLRRISEELVVARDREAELLRAIDALEEQLRTPRPLSEPEMLDALGAETTRLLRSAREAANEIRNKGEERATQLLEEARAEAERVGAETDELRRARTEEAEAHAAGLVSHAEAHADEIRSATETYSTAERLRAERETEDLVESARQQGREMLEEAKATRERVLSDLFRRRSLLQAQVEALRAGRDNLLDAYRVVKRTFLEATGALAEVEARAAADRAARESSPGDTVVGPEEFAPSDSEAESEAVDAVEAAATGADAGEPTDPSLADVESLFARIRAGQTEAIVESPTADDGDVPAETDGEGESEDAGASDATETVASEVAEPQPAPETEHDTVASWRTRRAELLGPLVLNVAKRAKRTAQDDQNALLDAVRRHKGRPTAAQVLPPESDLLAAWAAVIQSAFDEAYVAGRGMVGGEPARAEESLARDAAATIVLPLRERIANAIDTGEDGDTGGLVERIGARFREWKNQSLEDALVDVLTLAWSRGVYDASPDGAVLRWIPAVEGRCADCDDNGLEPTVKGSSFPTGQLHPPAHPGCRCLLAPADLLRPLAASA